LLAVAVALGWSGSSLAAGPIISFRNSSDPRARVHDGKLYLYTSQDLNKSGNWPMNKTFCYSLKDGADPGTAASWNDHGAVVDESKDYAWAKNAEHLWAPDSFKGPDGKFYMYVPDVQGPGNNASLVGVMVGSSPTGPYAPPSGMTTSNNSLQAVANYMSDPSVFADPKDPKQQRYLLYADGDFNGSGTACGHLSIAKLDQETSKLSENQKVTISGAPSGEGGCNPAYYEGGEIAYFGDAGFDGNGKYFIYFAMKESSNTESIAYATADKVTGPYTYQGLIMSGAGGQGWTNQASIVEWQGHYLFFYHNDPRGGANPQRQVFLECAGISNGKISSVARGSYKTLNDCPKANTGMTGTGGGTGVGGAGGGSSLGGATGSGGSNSGGTTGASGGRSSASGGRSSASGGRTSGAGGSVAGGNNSGSVTAVGGSSTGGSSNSAVVAAANGGSTGVAVGNGGAAPSFGGSSNNGIGGTPASVGSISTAGATGTPSDSSDGCSCNLAEASKTPASSRALGALAFGALALVMRRRRSTVKNRD
jgi:hypothetical protein